MMKRWVLALMLAIFAHQAMSTEHPQYQKLKQHGAYEVRQYPAMLIAQVRVTGNMADAGSKGFRILANYIFGNNTPSQAVNTAEKQKIAMTAPVTRSEVAPQEWVIAFFMPSQWNLDTLPLPNNSSIEIIHHPAERVAAVRFSGRWSESKYRKQHQALEQWLATQNLEAAGHPKFAGYDAPWVLPPLRRNEVLIPLQANTPDKFKTDF